MSEIKVSICCLTFNHEPYIKQCLDGFLMQKADFNFEILIHDDASVDNTATIIKEYEKKYPDIIKPIYQTKNQYSQGIKPTLIYNLPRIKGEYVAFCEGDDYWTDSFKLQKQINFLDNNEDCNYCGHKSSSLFGKRLNKITVPYEYIYFENVIFKNILNTSSLVFRKKCVEELPDYFSEIPAGDWALQLFSLKNSRAYIIDEFMSVYRVHKNGVWSGLDKKIQCLLGVRTQEYAKFFFTDRKSMKLINQAIKARKISGGIISLTFKDKLFASLRKLIK